MHAKNAIAIAIVQQNAIVQKNNVIADVKKAKSALANVAAIAIAKIAIAAKKDSWKYLEKNANAISS